MTRTVLLLVAGYVLGGFFPNPARLAAQWLAAKWRAYVK
jgi:hypothetical protein